MVVGSSTGTVVIVMAVADNVVDFADIVVDGAGLADFVDGIDRIASGVDGPVGKLPAIVAGTVAADTIAVGADSFVVIAGTVAPGAHSAAKRTSCRWPAPTKRG